MVGLIPHMNFRITTHRRLGLKLEEPLELGRGRIASRRSQNNLNSRNLIRLHLQQFVLSASKFSPGSHELIVIIFDARLLKATCIPAANEPDSFKLASLFFLWNRHISTRTNITYTILPSPTNTSLQRPKQPSNQISNSSASHITCLNPTL